MLLVGEAGAGMFSHQDSLRTASWQLQMAGRKQWHLCSPSQTPHLYTAGQVDFFRPQYYRFPLARNASCYQTSLSPGDLLFYPPDWWHQTLNLDTPTLALTGTLVTPSNYLFVKTQLERQCGGAGDIFPATDRFCRLLKGCYDLWERLWGSENDQEL
mmetsp:Transcript_22635/g.31016  ORF Transcript_22635/g.31016 Transcript_22635/m.31016 type:complete len:157 (-) Transcript_22635:1048-1518(-)